MSGIENISPRTEVDARLLAALEQAREAGWLGSERSLAQDIGLPITVFYKVRTSLQSFPKEGLFSLEALLGLSPAFVREGQQPPFRLPAQPETIKRSVYERLRIAGLAQNLTANTVAERMGLSPAKWKMLKAGNEAQLPGLAQSISQAFPLLSTAWLLLGIGTASAALDGPFPLQPARLQQVPLALEAVVVHLPFVDTRARAGFVSAYLSGTRVDNLPLQPYLSKANLRPTADSLLIEVEGDSMMPTLHSGDVLLIAPVPITDWKFLSGGVYTVLFGSDHLVVKRVKRNTLATEGTLRLESDNPTGGQIELQGADIIGIFKVLAITRNL